MSGKGYDPICMRVVEHFLADEIAIELDRHAELAQLIQDTIETWIITTRNAIADRDWRKIPIDDMELSTRAYRCFCENQDWLPIKTVGDIDRHSDRELLHMLNFGRKSLKEVREEIKRIRQEHGR